VSRCYLARRRVDRLRTLKAAETCKAREAAAVTIQAAVRGRLARATVVAHRARCWAAVRLQAAVRGWLARKRVAQKHHALWEAAVVIQCAVRGHLGRKRALLHRCLRAEATLQCDAAARVVQAAVRGFMARRRLVEAVVVIQGVSRCYLARRRVDRLRTLKETAERRTAAAASVQRLARGFLARRRVARALRLRAVEVEVEAQHGAAVVMQAAARGWLHRRRACSQDRAALYIQVGVEGGDGSDALCVATRRPRCHNSATAVCVRERTFVKTHWEVARPILNAMPERVLT
jgi:hypothetical protein